LDRGCRGPRRPDGFVAHDGRWSSGPSPRTRSTTPPTGSVLDAVFAEPRVTVTRTTHDPLDDAIERVTRGGFPEAVARTPDRRRRFFSAYLDDLIDRDVAQH